MVATLIEDNSKDEAFIGKYILLLKANNYFNFNLKIYRFSSSL